MRPIKRYFILAYGLFETFVFSGNVLGWSALHSLLVKIQVFRDVCEPVTNSSFVVSPEVADPCAQQDSLLNLAYTIASFSLGATSFLWGFLLDKYGLKSVRIVLNIFLLLGTLLLSLTQRSRSYLIFPSLILMSLAGVPLRMANLQISSLFPAYRSTVIALYSGAFAASSAVFVFIKYAYDGGLPWEWSCSILVILTIVMLFVTLFVLPTNNFNDDELATKASKENEVAGIVPAVWGSYLTLNASDLLSSSSSSNDSKSEKEDKSEVKIVCNSSVKEPVEVRLMAPLRQSFLSVSYLMHQYWFCWLLYYSIFFVGTLHLWSKATFDNVENISFTDNDLKPVNLTFKERVASKNMTSSDSANATGDYYAELYCLLQMFGILLSPICGAFMDWNSRRITTEKDFKILREKIVRSTFWPLTLTLLATAGAQVSSFFFTKAALWSSIIFVTIFRTMLLSIGTAYLSIRFPAEHFNKLVGIMSTVAAVFTVLQFPLFLWARSSPTESLMQVNIFNTACLLVACVHPLLILITPLQRMFLKNEEAVQDQHGEK